MSAFVFSLHPLQKKFSAKVTDRLIREIVALPLSAFADPVGTGDE